MLQSKILRCLTTISNTVKASRSFNTSSVLLLKQRWRKENNLPMNPHYALVEGPDYTFLDGRLTPYGTRQKKRIFQQRELRDQIIELSSEIDFAIERHENLQIEEENKMRKILNKKLKAKGIQLLKKSNGYLI